MALVAVSGVSGYLGSHVAQQLVQAGFKVRGTVRDLNNATKVAHLKAELPGVELFEADLLKEGSFDSVVAGCEFVVHTASPFQFDVEDFERDLIRPAVDGTLNILGSALKSGTVKRVVITSSVAAVIDLTKPETFEGRKQTCDDWNKTSTADSGPGAYRVSKTKAEEAAWKFVEDHKGERAMELVSMNPAFILGPPLSAREDATSIKLIQGFFAGSAKNGARPVCVGAVDVRDVAAAHVRGLQVPEAAGKRFLLLSNSGAPYTHLELNVVLRAAGYDDWPLATTALEEPKARAYCDVTPAETVLGIKFKPLGVTLPEMAASLIAQGVVKR